MMSQSGNYIVVQLNGGLGNQMFQYAAARALADKFQCNLWLDTTVLGTHSGSTPRQYALGFFNVRAQVAHTELTDEAALQFASLRYRWSHRWPALFSSRHVLNEKSLAFDERIGRLRPPVYLRGYWQSEKYFHHIADTLRQSDFTPATAAGGENARLLKWLAANDAISMHIRRGDYARHAATNAYHGLCSPEYYQRAARHLVQLTGVKHFLVFSDEPQWVLEHITLPYPMEMVSHNSGTQSAWDVVLMQHCRHHIIANSSFSWWGAWLNGSADKKVIAPAQWFARNDIPAQDLLPAEWIRL